MESHHTCLVMNLFSRKPAVKDGSILLPQQHTHVTQSARCTLQKAACLCLDFHSLFTPESLSRTHNDGFYWSYWVYPCTLLQLQPHLTSSLCTPSCSLFSFSAKHRSSMWQFNMAMFSPLQEGSSKPLSIFSAANRTCGNSHHTWLPINCRIWGQSSPSQQDSSSSPSCSAATATVCFHIRTMLDENRSRTFLWGVFPLQPATDLALQSCTLKRCNSPGKGMHSKHSTSWIEKKGLRNWNKGRHN